MKKMCSIEYVVREVKECEITYIIEEYDDESIRNVYETETLERAREFVTEKKKSAWMGWYDYKIYENRKPVDGTKIRFPWVLVESTKK